METLQGFKTLEVRSLDGVLVAEFLDKVFLDEHKIQLIGEEFCRLSEMQYRTIVLEYKRVECVSPAIIGKLVLLSKEAKTKGIILKHCSVGSSPMGVFRITRLDQCFEIYEDLAAALRSC